MRGNLIENTDRWLCNVAKTAKSIVRVAALSRKAETPKGESRNRLLILGNGPSLKEVMDKNLDWLRRNETMAVNFAANTPEFFVIKPKYYVLADPHFFRNTDDENVARLIKNINRIDWPMTLFIPHGSVPARNIFSSPKLDIRRYNLLAVEGFKWFEEMAFAHGWGMPRPRNVLIPSIMLGLSLGYKEIVLLGADHSWLSTLSVDDENRVVSIQEHFYQEDEKELARIRREYVSLPLHEVVQSMAIAFRAYHRIQQFASKRGKKIVNATKGSMIDAFPRVNHDDLA